MPCTLHGTERIRCHTVSLYRTVLWSPVTPNLFFEPSPITRPGLSFQYVHQYSHLIFLMHGLGEAGLLFQCCVDTTVLILFCWRRPHCLLEKQTAESFQRPGHLKPYGTTSRSVNKLKLILRSSRRDGYRVPGRSGEQELGYL